MPRKANPALLKPMNVDGTLAAVIGSGIVSRGQAMKKVWEYIKGNNLQDSQNRRQINADAKLMALFGGAKHVTMFEIGKHVFAHLS